MENGPENEGKDEGLSRGIFEVMKEVVACARAVHSVEHLVNRPLRVDQVPISMLGVSTGRYSVIVVSDGHVGLRSGELLAIPSELVPGRFCTCAGLRQAVRTLLYAIDMYGFDPHDLVPYSLVPKPSRAELAAVLAEFSDAMIWPDWVPDVAGELLGKLVLS